MYEKNSNVNRTCVRAVGHFELLEALLVLLGRGMIPMHSQFFL